jgi:hypothetical protein
MGAPSEKSDCALCELSNCLRSSFQIFFLKKLFSTALRNRFRKLFHNTLLKRWTIQICVCVCRENSGRINASTILGLRICTHDIIFNNKKKEDGWVSILNGECVAKNSNVNYFTSRITQTEYAIPLWGGIRWYMSFSNWTPYRVFKNFYSLSTAPRSLKFVLQQHPRARAAKPTKLAAFASLSCCYLPWKSRPGTKRPKIKRMNVLWLGYNCTSMQVYSPPPRQVKPNK